MAPGLGPAAHELSFDPLLSSTFNIDFGSLAGSAGGAGTNSHLAHGQGAAGGGFAAPFPTLQLQARLTAGLDNTVFHFQCSSVCISTLSEWARHP